MKRLDNRYYLAAAVLIACAAAFPLFAGGGLLNTRGGGDSPFLIQRLHQLTTAIQDGHFPVRWMPDANYGYGYPFFNFYASLAFYVAYIFRVLGFGTIRAIQLSQLAGFVVAGWGMYRLALRWWSRPSVALLVSAAYTLAPFHLVNVYVRGDSIAEFWAMAFYPLVIWAVDALFDSEENGEFIYQTAVLGLLYGGLVISHNVSAMIFSPFVGFYALGCMWRDRSTQRAFFVQSAYFAAAIFCGLAVSAWFWLPAIGEQGLTQLSEITVGYFDYNFGDGFHFRSTNLWQTSFLYDPNVADGNAFRMGLVQAILIVLGLGAWGWQTWHQKTVSRQSLLLLGGLLLATFMMHPSSRFLWGSLPLISYTQFPWRFLSIQAFWGAAVCGHLLLLFKKEDGRKEGTAVQTLSLFALLALLFASSLTGFQHDYLVVPESGISGEGIAQYEWFTGNIGTTISAEYLSGTMSPRPYTSEWLQTGDRWQVKALTGQASADLLSHRTQEQVWRVRVDSEESTVTFPLMFWPGWVAETAAGERLDLHTLDGSGLARLTLPQGEHEIVLRLTRTTIRLIGELVSLIAIPFLLGVVWWQRPLNTSQWSPEPRRIFAVVACMAVVVVLNQNSERQLQQLPDGVMSWDFGLMGYLHYDGQVTYGNRAVLADVTYSADEVEAGDSVEITLDWTQMPDGDIRQAQIVLTTPANNFFNHVEPIALESNAVETGTAVYSLKIDENAPAGLYVPYLWLSDRNRPRTPTGNKRAGLYLPPIRVTNTPETAVGNSRDLDVRAISITHVPPRILYYQMEWFTTAPLDKPYIVSLRLTDTFGQEMHQSQADSQIGYGQRPSNLWPSNTWVDDWLTVHLPEDGAPFPPPYVVIAKLYDATDGRGLLTRRLGELVGEDGSEQLRFVPHQPRFDLPEEIIETDVVMETADGQPLIALRGYQIHNQSEDGKLDLTLYWEALDQIPADFYHFVHLVNPETGTPAAQHDGQPQNNTYPTSQWQTGEIVADPLTIFTAELPNGEYQLTTGLYEIVGDTYPRLTAVVGANEEATPDGVVPLQAYTK